LYYSSLIRADQGVGGKKSRSLPEKGMNKITKKPEIALTLVLPQCPKGKTKMEGGGQKGGDSKFP